MDYDYSSSSSEYQSESDEEHDQHFDDCMKQFTVTDSVNQAYCNVCKYNFFYNKQCVIQHVAGEQHSQAVSKLLDQHDIAETQEIVYYCNYCNSYTDDFMKHIHSNTDHINWMWIYGEVDKDKLKHYIYRVDEGHNEANKYKELYETLLERNKIRRLNCMMFFCDACSCKLGRVTEIDHMFGQRHKSGLWNYHNNYKV